MNITNAKVLYSRTVKPADYEGKTGSVELTVVFDEGEDVNAVLLEVSNMAKARALAMVDIKPATTKADDLGGASKGGTKEAAAAALNAADKKEPTAAEKKAAAKKAAEEAAAKKAAEEAAAKKAEPTGEDPGFNEDEVPLEVTDLQLAAAMNAKVKVLKEKHGGAAPTLIKALIAKFVEPPKKSTDIPQNVRSEFLKKLEALE